jgi:low affinity Fe/Cu permease
VTVGIPPHVEATDHRRLAHEAERISRAPSRYGAAARRLTRWAGSLGYVLGLLVLLVAWVVVGAATGFPRWWEVVVTVGFPFLTLVLLALVQHSQNHDSNAIELKLDELIASLDGPSDAMLRVEEASEDDLERLQQHYGSQVR